MVRQFLSATLSAVAARVAPKPKIHPWPFALGAGFTVLGAFWLWVLNEEAKVARAKDAGTTAAILGHRARLNAIEAERFDLRGRGEVVRARVEAIEKALDLPRIVGEDFAEPRSHGECSHRCARGPVAAGQFRTSVRSCTSPRVVRVVNDYLGQPGIFCVRVAVGDPLGESELYTAETIERSWPILFNGDALSDAELARCGIDLVGERVEPRTSPRVAHVVVRAEQIRQGDHGVVRVVEIELGPAKALGVLVARGLPRHDGPRSEQEIEHEWPVVIGAEELTAAERFACGLPSESPSDLDASACPTGGCTVEHG